MCVVERGLGALANRYLTSYCLLPPWMGSLSPIPLPPGALGPTPSPPPVQWPRQLCAPAGAGESGCMALGCLSGGVQWLSPPWAETSLCIQRVICPSLVPKSNSAWIDCKLLSVGSPLRVRSVIQGKQGHMKQQIKKKKSQVKKDTFITFNGTSFLFFKQGFQHFFFFALSPECYISISTCLRLWAP